MLIFKVSSPHFLNVGNPPQCTCASELQNLHFKASRLQILRCKASKFTLQGFKILASRLQNSFFKALKFALQGFKIQASRLQNSRFKALKFALQGFKVLASELENSDCKASKFAFQGFKIWLQSCKVRAGRSSPSGMDPGSIRDRSRDSVTIRD